MASRVTFVGNILSGDLISSSDNNTLPGGKIGRDVRTSNSSGTTTIETICSVTVTVGTSREIDIVGCVTVRSSVLGGTQAALYEDGIQVQRKNNENVPATSDQSWTLFGFTHPSAGSHTYDLATGASGAAGNTVTAIANGGAGTHGTCILNVYDAGPSF